MSEAERTLTTRRILLVEDEPGLQEALGLMLEIEGFLVTRASDGREALARLRDQRPDLIITDYMMPHMNGADLISRIRATPALAEVPILLMSAALPEQVDKSCADAFLEKPIGVTQLLRQIESLLRQVNRTPQ